MNLTIEHDGRRTSGVAFADAVGRHGYPPAVAVAALKAAAKTRITAMADMHRAELEPASAGKLAEYRIKEEISRDPAGASAAELTMVDREAVARGLDRAALLAVISAKASAYREAALLVGALEAEAKAAIDALADDAADIEDQVQAVLTGVQEQAQADIAAAQAALAN
ncbi:hypothetical protein [Thalassovita aquimarina]|uniref:Terminase small subunit n=1 Tax=Thalassovita aquimarina TaxID=2785917 RepID=A0ABS5HSM2_9RHOB|nr:hypothetical protein [Thalassovita aquimarina]MBR9651920.1 hypothetical protein [Thalassovita aquimarina]